MSAVPNKYYLPSQMKDIFQDLQRRACYDKQTVIVWYNRDRHPRGKIWLTNVVPGPVGSDRLDDQLTKDILGIPNREFVGRYTWKIMRYQLHEDIKHVIGGDENETTTRKPPPHRLCLGGSKATGSGYLRH